ncbi:hypothetical protein KK083_13770 [Fulvivirgaceae bacterium PWU4]|jgi:hypothetical protein|uniref:Uncharacterized protein n=1 Tax=Chryseosolibacter histidini TaxID=2782349 RepID=A0AAP2GJ45_9BACT|nr:hypothetical protein [Chryseosolibacter histidini]MBT1697956.1 hypothetical protein [Chryseosolibacter histidini]
MKYIELFLALDLLAKYYPRYYSHELISLAEDVFKWLNNELPEDSSTLAYLKSCFSSPTEAWKAIWQEIQLMAGPHLHPN